MQRSQLDRWLLNTGIIGCAPSHKANTGAREAQYLSAFVADILSQFVSGPRWMRFPPRAAEGHAVCFIYFVSSTLADPAASWLPRKQGASRIRLRYCVKHWFIPQCCIDIGSCQYNLWHLHHHPKWNEQPCQLARRVGAEEEAWKRAEACAPAVNLYS